MHMHVKSILIEPTRELRAHLPGTMTAAFTFGRDGRAPPLWDGIALNLVVETRALEENAFVHRADRTISNPTK